VSYPARAVQIFGWEAHWLVVFMAFSFVAALLLKTRFKVAL